MTPGFIFRYGEKYWIVQDNLKCIPWSLEIMTKEMKAKKEMKKPPMAKHMDAKEDKKMVKKMVKKSCVK
jgi:hypothetical protein